MRDSGLKEGTAKAGGGGGSAPYTITLLNLCKTEFNSLVFYKANNFQDTIESYRRLELEY